jgi:hypothetical protein
LEHKLATTPAAWLNGQEQNTLDSDRLCHGRHLVWSVASWLAGERHHVGLEYVFALRNVEVDYSRTNVTFRTHAKPFRGVLHITFLPSLAFSRASQQEAVRAM